VVLCSRLSINSPRSAPQTEICSPSITTLPAQRQDFCLPRTSPLTTAAHANPVALPLLAVLLRFLPPLCSTNSVLHFRALSVKPFPLSPPISTIVWLRSQQSRIPFPVNSLFVKLISPHLCGSRLPVLASAHPKTFISPRFLKRILDIRRGQVLSTVRLGPVRVRLPDLHNNRGSQGGVRNVRETTWGSGVPCRTSRNIFGLFRTRGRSAAYRKFTCCQPAGSRFAGQGHSNSGRGRTNQSGLVCQRCRSAACKTPVEQRNHLASRLQPDDGCSWNHERFGHQFGPREHDPCRLSRSGRRAFFSKCFRSCRRFRLQPGFCRSSGQTADSGWTDASTGGSFCLANHSVCRQSRPCFSGGWHPQG